MPRRKVVAKRAILPDSRYGNKTIAKFINIVMKSGKKSVAERIVYNALAYLEERLKSKKDHQKEEGAYSKRYASTVELFIGLLDAVRPTVEVKARRVGGSTYQVPVEVRANRAEALAMRWIIEAATNRGEKGMELKLAAEFYEILEGRGAAVKKRETVHAMAKANQAFAHLAAKG